MRICCETLTISYGHVCRKKANRYVTVMKKDVANSTHSVATFHLVRNSRQTIHSLLQRFPLTAKERQELQQRLERNQYNEGLYSAFKVRSIIGVWAAIHSFRSYFLLKYEFADILTSFLLFQFWWCFSGTPRKYINCVRGLTATFVIYCSFWQHFLASFCRQISNQVTWGHSCCGILGSQVVANVIAVV